jgi:uncharacterized protein (DUF1501 family)
MRRRDGLRWGLGLAAAASSWRVWATPPAAQVPPRLLLVFLRGAYDNLNTLVPHADAFYAEARPNIAVPGPGQPNGCMPLDGRWGLHPALAESMGSMWTRNELLMVPFAGTAFVSRSHFQAQDWMEMAGPAAAGYSAATGFMNRLQHELGGRSQAVALTAHMPVAMRGPARVYNAAVSGNPTPPAKLLQGSQQDALLAMYQGHPMAQMWQEGLGLENAVRSASMELAQLQKAQQGQMQQGTMNALDMDPASRQAMPANAFALQAARVAQLLKTQPHFRLAMIDVGGWDTHANQGGATGAMANRLHSLGEGLGSLATQLGPNEWRQTVVLVMSEFGRTFHENGTRGTDHGHGSALWLLGGAVRGGRVWGEQSDLTPETLHQKRDLPVLNEYRAILGGLFQRMYGLDAQALARVFPQTQPLRGDWV